MQEMDLTQFTVSEEEKNAKIVTPTKEIEFES